MSVIIDAGHQGKGFDPGAVGNGIVEADMVLEISLYQYKRFQELKVPVKVTRTSTKKMSNTERANLVKNSGMKHCMSNHINAGGGDGAEVIYSVHAKPKFSQTVLDALTKAGQNPRKIFTRKLSTNSTHDYYYMHRLTGSVETIIVEYGFLDSKKDDVWQLKNEWKTYAEAVVKAYCEYAGYKYIAPNTVKVEEPVKELTEYEKMVAWAKDNKVFDGTNLNTPVTRKQVALMATRTYNLLSVPTETSDVWQLQWAINNGITDGSNMDGIATREQVAVMVARLANLVSGLSKPSTYAEQAEWSRANAIYDGNNPRNQATRSQTAVMLGRLYKLMKK